MFCCPVVSGAPGDQTHLFKVRAKAPLTFPCIVWGSDGQLAPMWAGPAAALPAGCPTDAAELGGDPWPHQMPYGRDQSMPHTVQTNSIFHRKCPDLHMIADTFRLAEWTLHVYNLIFQMHELWSDPQPLATANTPRLVAFCREFQIYGLFGCDTVQMATLITRFCQEEPRQHQWGLPGGITLCH